MSHRMLRAKLDAMIHLVDLDRVFDVHERPTEGGWRKQMSNIALAEPLGLLRPDEEPDVHALGARISRMLSGARPLTPTQFVRLAQWARLDRFLGGAEEGAHCLGDAVAVETFVGRLFDSGWANPALRARFRYATRTLLLDAFERFGLNRAGIVVGPEIVVRAAAPGPTRGARLPRPEDADGPLPEFALGTRLKIRLDITAAHGLVLLQVSPQMTSNEGYEIQCLAPSPIVPRESLQPPAPILPALAHHGIDAFVVDRPLGRHDWLAILTATPLALPWPRAEASLHVVSPPQLDALIDVLAAEISAGRAVEVRQFPFSVISGPTEA